MKHKQRYLLPLLAAVISSLLLPTVILADDTTETLTDRLVLEGRYDIVMGGVGMYDGSITEGDITLGVPATADGIVAAYLYWSGFDDCSTAARGDPQVTLQVGGTTHTIDAAETWGADDYFWFGSNYRFLHIAEVTDYVTTGTQTYTVSDFNCEAGCAMRRDGVGLLIVYEDASLPYNRLVIKDGLDRGHRRWAEGPRAETAVNCFDIVPTGAEFDLAVSMFTAGVENANRPNALWYQVSTGPKPVDWLNAYQSAPATDPTTAGAALLHGPTDDNKDYPFIAADGGEWDTYTNAITIPSNATWLCLQVESDDDPNGGTPASLAQIMTAAVYPIDYDMGDLLDIYSTTLATGGPLHSRGTAWLGALWDAEPDGTPSDYADGDDQVGSDDEDGVQLIDQAGWGPNAACNVQVTVSDAGAASDYVVAGWIDWNGDAAFGSGESFTQTVTVGNNTVNLICPADFTNRATGQPLYGRFRLYESTPAGFSPTGPASGGEVEDYKWLFKTTAVTIGQLGAQSSIPHQALLVSLGAVLALSVPLVRRKRR